MCPIVFYKQNSHIRMVLYTFLYKPQNTIISCLSENKIVGWYIINEVTRYSIDTVYWDLLIYSTHMLNEVCQTYSNIHWDWSVTRRRIKHKETKLWWLMLHHCMWYIDCLFVVSYFNCIIFIYYEYVVV